MKNLSSAQLKPIKIQVTRNFTHLVDGEVVNFSMVEQECHWYTFVENAEGSSIDLYRVRNGRLERFAAYNGVVSAEEVE